MNPTRNRLSVWLRTGMVLVVIFVEMWIAQSLHADIVTLKDGTTLRCEVISESQSSTTGAHYLEVRIGQSVIWLNQSAVDRIETTQSPEPTHEEVQELVKRLTSEGVLMPAPQEKVDLVPSPQPLREKEISLHVQEIRGWAYVYENEQSLRDHKLTALRKGDSIPLGYILIVSPNSRATLDLPDIGEIGLEAGVQIRFSEAVLNRSRRSYSLSLFLDNGRLWLKVKADNRVILSINSVRSIIQDAALYAATTEKTSAFDLTLLNSSGEVRFSRNRPAESPYALLPGQVLRVDPGTNQLPVENSSLLEALRQRIESWKDWQPEALVLNLNAEIPPLKAFPSFRALPALHPYRLPLDQSLLMPPELRSQGEILAIYRDALNQYRLDTGKFPTFDHGLDALTRSFDIPGWRGPYVPLELPRRDAWGSPLVYDIYTEKGRSYADVRSNGPNGKDDKGLGDDLR